MYQLEIKATNFQITGMDKPRPLSADEGGSPSSDNQIKT